MKISAQTMAAVSGLLDQVLELPLSEREPWLQKLAQTQPEMVPVLREMLAAGQQPDFSQILQTVPRIGGDSSATVATAALHNGERIGPYLLKRELGVGGMAVVWLAERADGAFKRDVALKLPMLSRLRRDLADRFTRERDILASLEHPNIARLYDAGVAEDGLPYLALEYVEGQPITTWCDSHRYGVRERLKLFLQVLDAVQYAHARHVIHRDIKPSNILVTESGQVRLLDFGIAKLLIEGETAEETQLTQVYGRAFTVDYASPEQLRGEPITAASDIYSLGVVLYELLTGNRPYQIKATTAALIELAIVNAEIARPSTHVGPEAAESRSTTSAKIEHRLKGDLDAIILKTLAKPPTDRYASAAALADDLQRYLSGEPVEAQPDRLAYRIKKYVARHRTGATIAAVTACAFAAVIGIVLTRPSSKVPTDPRASSAQVGDRSIAVLPFIDMSERKDQEYFSDGLSEELIDHLAKIHELKVIARTSSFQFKGKNEDMRSIAGKLGVAHLLEGSVRKSGKSLRITAQLIRAADGSHLWSETYDRTQDDIFKVQDEIATAVVRELKLALSPGALASTYKAVNPEAHNLVLQGNYFKALYSAKDMARAVELYQQAIKLDPKYAFAWARLGSAYFNQALNDWAPERESIAKARRALEEAVRIDPNLAWAHYTLAGMYASVDWDWTAAQAEIDLLRKIDPADAFLLPMAVADLGGLHGRLEEAYVAYQHLLERDPLDSIILSTAAGLQFSLRRFAESAATSRQVIQQAPNYAGAHCLLGLALIYLGQHDEALLAVGQESDEVCRASTMPIAYWALGRTADSNAALRRLVAAHANDNAYGIAEIHAYRGEVDAAFEWLDRAYRQRDSGMSGLKSDLLLQNVRSDPRYQVLLTKMKLND